MHTASLQPARTHVCPGAAVQLSVIQTSVSLHKADTGYRHRQEDQCSQEAAQRVPGGKPSNTGTDGDNHVGVYLKQQAAVWLQADALAVRQSQQLVVIHDTVHVFYPHSIHITIKHQVLGLILHHR